MEENMICAAEIKRISYLNKKRKIQAELLDMPSAKHACWGKNPDNDSSSDSSTEQNYSRSSESNPEDAAKDGYSLDSAESKSPSYAGPSNSEPLSISDELERLRRDYGLDIYEDPLLEFGSHVDCVCLECQTHGVEHSMDEDIDEKNYVLSSGRPLNPDAQQGTKKLTIDKEFEEYFSTLML